jgi:hypothetical protein
MTTLPGLGRFVKPLTKCYFQGRSVNLPEGRTFVFSFWMDRTKPTRKIGIKKMDFYQHKLGLNMINKQVSPTKYDHLVVD